MGLKEAGLRGSLRSVSTGVDAIPDSVVDNYEDSPDGPYGTGDDITTYYSGDTGAASRTTTSPISGSYSLAIETSGNDYFGSIAGDGLPSYPEYGEVLSFQVQFPATDWDIDHHYVASSASTRDDGYTVGVFPGNGTFEIRRIDGGSPVGLQSSSYNYSSDTTYTIVCGVRDNSGNDEHFAELYNQNQIDRENDTPEVEISANDSTYVTSNSLDFRGIAFRMNTPGTNPYLVDNFWVRQ